MHHALFEEMRTLLAVEEPTDEQDARLAELLDLHDSGQAYSDIGAPDAD